MCPPARSSSLAGLSQQPRPVPDKHLEEEEQKEQQQEEEGEGRRNERPDSVSSNGR